MTDQPRTFDCTSCGAELTFAAGTDKLHCEYCGSEQVIGEAAAAAPVLEHDLDAALADMPRRLVRDLVQGGTEVRCSSCGAQTVLQGQAGSCPYCDSPVVLVNAAEQEEVIAPESVLPFKVTVEQARASFHRWVDGLWFAPNDLSERARADKIDGIYLPYWTFDARATTRYRGERGDDYTDTEYYTDSQGNRQSRTVTKTRWSSVSGTVRLTFDDVLVCGNAALPRDLIRQLEPWDLGELRPFDPAYLSGFVAERYAVDLHSAWREGQERMDERLRAAVKRDIGGDRQRIHGMNTDLADRRFKLCLLPLWISSFRYSGTVYRFLVNARTGEVAGKRPWSWIKIALAVLAALLVVGTVLALIAAAQG